MPRVVSVSVSTTYTCDVDGVTTATVSGTDLPSGWKRMRKPVTVAERALGHSSKEVYICPTVLVSTNLTVLEALRDLVAE